MPKAKSKYTKITSKNFKYRQHFKEFNIIYNYSSNHERISKEEQAGKCMRENGPIKPYTKT